MGLRGVPNNVGAALSLRSTAVVAAVACGRQKGGSCPRFPRKRLILELMPWSAVGGSVRPPAYDTATDVAAPATRMISWKCRRKKLGTLDLRIASRGRDVSDTGGRSPLSDWHQQLIRIVPIETRHLVEASGLFHAKHAAQPFQNHLVNCLD